MAAKPAPASLLSPQVRQVLSNLSQRIFYQEPRSRAYNQFPKEEPGEPVFPKLFLILL